jgi:hypothetical protein
MAIATISVLVAIVFGHWTFSTANLQPLIVYCMQLHAVTRNRMIVSPAPPGRMGFFGVQVVLHC